MPITKWTRDSLKGSTKTQGDFNLTHRFTVEIDGVAIGGVNNIEGLEHEHEVVEFQDCDDQVTRFRPGRQKQGRVKIHRDFSATKEFFNWRKTVTDGKVERKSISIILLNDAGEEAMRYNLHECWPIKYHGPSLNSRNSGHATEAIEVAFEVFEMK
jgi:phage tail-like protein